MAIGLKLCSSPCLLSRWLSNGSPCGCVREGMMYREPMLCVDFVGA